MRNEYGQALAELPVVVLVLCVLALLLLQPLAMLYTKMALGQVAAELSRVAACAGTATVPADEKALTVWAADKLEGLPKGSAFMMPGSLKVSVSGDAHSTEVKVRVSVRQKPLVLPAFFGRSSGGTVEVSGHASAPGTLLDVEGEPASAPQVFGKTD
jgi:hypothetical protein